MRWRAIPALLCCLLIFGPAPAAEPESSFKPTAVMRLRPLEDLIGDFRYLVKQLDRVETLLQAEAYASRQPDLPIGSFRSQVAAMALPDDLADLAEGC